jgi:hypothetical protein
VKQTIAKLRPGDLVQVKTPAEILLTLDKNGALDQVPFMPEMIEFCGGRFRVAKRVLKTCCSSGTESNMRTFPADNVVLLEGLRCSGASHGGCQKACTIFWREDWLRKVEDDGVFSRATGGASEDLRARLKTTSGPTTYFCQSSEIVRATRRLARWERFGKCFADIRVGNCTAFQMAQRVSIWLFWRVRRAFLGAYARGRNKSTPVASLGLQAGDSVEVIPIASISGTLNDRAYNRGLYFSPDMRLLCGRKQRVERKIEKIIVDGTGEMRRLRNTVYLEGSHCGCSHVAFGGCPRREFAYWREIWLRRPGTAESRERGISQAEAAQSPDLTVGVG